MIQNSSPVLHGHYPQPGASAHRYRQDKPHIVWGSTFKVWFYTNITDPAAGANLLQSIPPFLGMRRI